MSFIQIVDYESEHQDEIMAAARDQMTAAAETGSPRIVVTSDRDKPHRYLIVVEFDSYEQAMANSSSASVQAFAAKLSALAKVGPSFTNLDVTETAGR